MFDNWNLFIYFIFYIHDRKSKFITIIEKILYGKKRRFYNFSRKYTDSRNSYRQNSFSYKLSSYRSPIIISKKISRHIKKKQKKKMFSCVTTHGFGTFIVSCIDLTRLFIIGKSSLVTYVLPHWIIELSRESSFVSDRCN